MLQLPKYTLLAITALFVFVSCKKEEAFTSRIHFINATIGSQPFSLKADSNVIAAGIKYDSLKADNIVPSGTFTISLSSSTQAIVPFLTNLQAGETYTAVLYDSTKRTQFFMRKDVYPATPGAGRCAIRIYNLIPGSSNLFLGSFKGIRANNKDTAKSYITGSSFNNFASGTTSPDFTEIDTITRPRIYTADTTRLAILPTLLPGKMYTFYLTGSIKDTIMLHPKCIVQVHN